MKKTKDPQNQKDGHLGFEFGIVLQIQVKGIKGYALSSLIGRETGQYLIVNTPTLPGFVSKLNKDNQVIVRYVHNGTVYGFQCTLTNFLDKPYRLSFLSYPEHIETMNLRTHQRVSCFLPASVKIENVDYEGVVLDLSVSGCSFFHLSDDIDEFPDVHREEMVRISLQLLGAVEDYVVKAIVKSFKRDDRKVVIGAEFQAMNREISKELENYIRKVANFKSLA